MIDMKRSIDILFACDMNQSRPWYRDRIPGIKEAIENNNYSIEMVDIYGLLGEQKYMPTHVSQRKLFLQNTNILKANETFEKNVISFMPKVLILGTADNYHEFLIPQTVRRLRDRGIYIVGILGDDEFNYPVYRFLLGWFDMFVAYVRSCVDYYEQFDLSKGYFFPNSCYLDNKKFSELSQDVEYDAILVGAPIANRAEMVKALLDEGLKIAIFGSKKWESYDFTNGCYHGFIPTEKFDEVLSKGKIILAFLEDHLTGKLHMNTKIWEAARIARLPIASYYEPLEKDYGLEEGVSIVTYKDTKELVNKVKFYSQNDEERNRIAENLYNKVANEFDYSLMYNDLFNHLIYEASNNVVKNVQSEEQYEFLKNNNIQYFGTKSSYLDMDAINIIKILKQINSNSVDYIYFNSIENGKRVINRWPFINFNNIFFLGNKKRRRAYIIIFFKSFFLSRTLHINQFYLISDHQTVNGKINRFIDRFSRTKLARWIRKYKR